MNIISKIKDSIYNQEYYKEVLTKPLSYSLKYYFLFILIFSLIAGTFTFFSAVPPVKVFLNMVSSKIADYYPDELEVTIKNGKASTNVQEPYFVKLPAEINKKDAAYKCGTLENIIVLDTKNKFDMGRFQSFKTPILLTEDSIVAYDDNCSIKISPLGNIQNANTAYVINKSKVVYYIDKIKPWLNVIYPVIFIFLWIGNFIILAIKLIYLLVAALLIWLVAKAKNTGIGYKKSYQLGIHLMTLPIILIFLLNISKIDIAFLFTGLLVIMAVFNIKNRA